MKSTKVATLLGLDPKTITNWTNHELLSKFFSEPAKKSGGERSYSEADLLVLNTIRVAREDNTEWVEIAKMLDGGYRDADLPPTALLADSTAVLSQYNKLSLAIARAEQLEVQLKELQELRREDQEAIGDLREEIGMLKGFLRSNGLDPKTGKLLDSS